MTTADSKNPNTEDDNDKARCIPQEHSEDNLMSVVCETKWGWCIDHEMAVAEIYQRCELNGSGQYKSYWLNSAMFDIQCPFMMDSQFENWKQQQDDRPVGTQTRKRKRRKQAEHLEELSVELSGRLMSAHKSLVAAARTHGRLQEKQELPDNNNTAARAAANIAGPGDKLAESAEMWSKGDNSWCSPVDITVAEELNMFDMFHRRVTNKGDNPCMIQLDGEHYLVPPSASFVMSDFEQLLANSESLHSGYDLIVVDPPWMNKSVKRKRSYCWLNEECLLRLPITDLAADGCLIVVWVTNKTRLLEFVKDELLSAWGVQHVKQWHWLKVTVTGSLVCNMNSSTKKPYETLLLGRVEKTQNNGSAIITAPQIPREGDISTVTLENSTSEGDNSSISTDISISREVARKSMNISTSGGDNLTMSPGGDSSDVLKVVNTSKVDSNSDTILNTQDSVSDIPDSCVLNTEDSVCDIPDSRVLLSIPCSLHSKKPPILDVLRQYLPSEPHCLELFARNLWPGWVSWGHEALKHQHIDFYEEKT